VTLTKYAKIAGPAIEAHGGHFLARGIPVKVYEVGLNQRLVIIEFESVKKAIEAIRQSRISDCVSNFKGFPRARRADYKQL